MRVNVIWSFLFEYFIGKRLSLKDAWKNHKKKLFLISILFLSLLLNVKLYTQAKKFKNAYQNVSQSYKNSEEDLLVCEMNIVAVRDMNRRLTNSVQTLGRIIEQKEKKR